MATERACDFCGETPAIRRRWIEDQPVLCTDCWMDAELGVQPKQDQP